MSPSVRAAANQPGTALSRHLICLGQANGLPGEALQIAARHCLTTPENEEVFRAVIEGRHKGAVGAGHLGNADWAGALAQYGIAREFFTLIDEVGIFGRLKKYMRRVPFRVKTPRELGDGTGAAWRGEGVPRPVRRTDTDLMTVDVCAAGAIFVATRELLRFNPTAEALIRSIVIAGVSRYIDGQLLDPSVTASPGGRPGSITSVGASHTSSGTSAANIVNDLEALIALIETNFDRPVWIMRPKTYATAVAKLAGVGLSVQGGRLLDIPVILGSSSPQQIAIVDGSAVCYAADDAVNLEVSTQADIEMLDSGLAQSGIVGTGAQMVNLWQSGLVAISAEFAVSWQQAHFEAGSPSQGVGVAYMATDY